MTKLTLTLATIFTTVLVAASLHAQEEVAATPQPAPVTEAAADEDSSLGLNIDLGFATAYVWRGANVFQEDSQSDQNTMLAPSITWSIFDTGLYLGYWGAFQLNGDNRGANIDGGVGAEQDLYVGWDFSLSDSFALSALLTYYFYPAADEAVAGVANPSYIEPLIGASFSSAVDIGLSVSYFIGLQEEVRGASHLYINPTISKNLELSSNIGLDMGFGYGFKVWKDGNDGASNVHDLLLGVSLPIAINRFYVAPALNLAWTNIEDGVDETGATIENTFGDGLVFWGGVNVGIDI